MRSGLLESIYWTLSKNLTSKYRLKISHAPEYLTKCLKVALIYFLIFNGLKKNNTTRITVLVKHSAQFENNPKY